MRQLLRPCFQVSCHLSFRSMPCCVLRACGLISSEVRSCFYLSVGSLARLYKENTEGISIMGGRKWSEKEPIKNVELDETEGFELNPFEKLNLKCETCAFVVVSGVRHQPSVQPKFLCIHLHV